MTGRFTAARAALAVVAVLAASIGAVAETASAAVSPGDPRNRVVGGARAETDDAPWVIQLSNTHSSSPTDEWCGGTLVKANKIVTAAHCAQEPITTYTAIQGRDVLSHKSVGTESKISRIWVDPAYDKKPGHDVAVLTLTTPFDGVPTLPLETSTAADAVGAASVVYGWGETEHTGRADTLRKVTVPVLGDHYCAKVYGKDYTAKGEICAGYKKGGTDACQGDSGGPLVLDDRLLGVVSWGEGCADAGHPGVYAEVATYATALQTHIDQLTNQNRDRHIVACGSNFP